LGFVVLVAVPHGPSYQLRTSVKSWVLVVGVGVGLRVV
jgi:hypothetical protein